MQEAARSQQVVTEADIEERKQTKKRGEERKDDAPVPLKLKKVAKGTWHFGDRMDRKRVVVVAEMGAVADTGRGQ